jgi:pectinesterase
MALVCLLPLGLRADDTTTRPATAGKIRIVLAGDSTVTDTAGWAPGFKKCLTDDVELINTARGGRSSKSFIKEGSWAKALALKPDYILIQFGHNDQPGHPGDRETDPQTTYKQYMTQYVDDARAAGIKPVLVTSMSRRQWGPDGKIHSTLAPYVEVVRQIAAEKNVPLVDLHSRSIELYERLGKDGCNAVSPLKAASTKPSVNKEETVADAPATQPGDQGKVFDGTHLNAKGSAMVGPLVAQELAKAVPDLAPYIKIPENAVTK